MTEKITIDSKCVFLKANGERYEANRLKDSDFCYFHSPEVVVARAEARRRGAWLVMVIKARPALM